MKCLDGKMVLHGIENINNKIDSILSTMNISIKIFEIKLIMIEAVTNAFYHGNNGNPKKPILIKWCLEDRVIIITVKDCGNQPFQDNLNQSLDKNMLSECGRGLTIIKSYSDEVHIRQGEITMKKILL